MKDKHLITVENTELDRMIEQLEILQPFNVARMVDLLIDGFGDGAAEHAQRMAGLARAADEPEIAEDYELVKKTILKRQRP